MALVGPGQQAQIQIGHESPRSTLVELLQQIRIMQDLEEMGEGAATDLDIRQVFRTERRPAEFPYGYRHGSRHHGRRTGTESRLQVQGSAIVRGQETSRACPRHGSSYVQPRPRNLQQVLGEQIEVEQPRQRSIPRVAGENSELRYERRLRNDRQDIQSLTYTLQMESLDPATLAELPEWLRKEIIFEREAVETEQMTTRQSSPESPPNSNRRENDRREEGQRRRPRYFDTH
jgi:hypothetical protein